jgi:hypothetical protein
MKPITNAMNIAKTIKQTPVGMSLLANGFCGTSAATPIHTVIAHEAMKTMLPRTNPTIFEQVVDEDIVTLFDKSCTYTRYFSIFLSV